VVTVERDPRSARSKLVLLSEAGVRRREETTQILAGLEAGASVRIPSPHFGPHWRNHGDLRNRR
jgi:hypothetical protein